jgi:peptidoglycan/xylan/chitin deacetylase (PgdA/CDA1 family)
MRNRIFESVGAVAAVLVALTVYTATPSGRGAAATSTPAADSLLVPILVYQSVAAHRAGEPRAERLAEVPDSVFALQMRYLVDRGFHVIPLATLVDALERHDTVPARSVVLTFDDGWANHYRNVVPVLRRLGLTATFFVYTTPIGTDNRFMTWDQLSELQTAGMTIGSHAWTHERLTEMHKWLRDEVTSSRTELAQRLGRAPDFFAYPADAWDEAVVAAVRSAGYRAARGGSVGVWNGSADLYHLRSVPVTEDMQAFVRVLDAASGSSVIAVAANHPPEV